MTRFGRFDDAAREYVISHPDTPLPWINYLGSEEYLPPRRPLPAGGLGGLHPPDAVAPVTTSP